MLKRDVPKHGNIPLHIADQSPKIAHTIPEAVAVSGLSRSALYIALRTGELHARKRGTRTLIEDAELRRFVASLPAYEPAP